MYCEKMGTCYICLLIMTLSLVMSQLVPRQPFMGGQRAIEYMSRTENDLTREFMDDVIDKAFERFKCSQRISDDCKTCLTGDRLFRLVNSTSPYLNSFQFESASQLILCYARDLENLCGDHDDIDDYDRCRDSIVSQLSDNSDPSTITASNIAEFLQELSENYSDRLEEISELVEDVDNDSSEEMEDETEDIDESNEIEDEDDEELKASLYSSNCVSSDKLFDELDLDEEDEIADSDTIGGISALILFHLTNGDRISPSCRTLPSRADFLDELFDETSDKTSMNYDEFRELLSDLNIGMGQTAEQATRSTSSFNVFTNTRVARDVSNVKTSLRHRNARTARDASNVKLSLHHRNTRIARDTSNVKLSLRHRRHADKSLSRQKRQVTKTMATDRCFSNDELLVLVKADRYGDVSKSRFKDICPALIQQQVSSACDGIVAAREAVQTSKKYIYTTIAGLIICACSLLGGTLIPCLSRSVYQTILVLYLGLAFGTLTAHTFLQLLPQAFGLHASTASRFYRKKVDVLPMWYSLAAFAALYFVYLLECIIEKSRSQPLAAGGTKRDAESNGHSKDHFKFSDVPGSFKEMYTKGVSPTVIIVGITDALHNLAAGLAVGIAFSYSYSLGLGTAISLTLQHAAHELGQAAVLLNAGLTIAQTIGLRVCVALLTMLGAYVGAITGDRAVQKWVFSLTAGMFLYIALAKIVPTILTGIQQTGFGLKFVVHNIGIILGCGLIVGLCVLDNHIYS